MNLLFRTCGLSCESSMPKLQKQRHEMTISLLSRAKTFSWKVYHQWCEVFRCAHPSSGRVGRPREALQSHLILKGRGWDDLSRRHGGHTLHDFVFGHLVLSEDNNIGKSINVQAELFLLITIFLSRYWKSHIDQLQMRCYRGKNFLDDTFSSVVKDFMSLMWSADFICTSKIHIIQIYIQEALLAW